MAFVFSLSSRAPAAPLAVKGEAIMTARDREGGAAGFGRGQAKAERLPAKAVVTLGGIGLSHETKGEIELE